MNFTELIRDWTFNLHRKAYQLKDQYKLQVLEYQNELVLAETQNTKLFDDVLRKELECTKKLNDALRTDLSKFKTRKTYKFNNQYKQLHQMLNIKAERDAVEDWVEEHLDLSFLNGQSLDEKAKRLRLLINDVAPSHTLYTADPVPNTFTMPSDLIANGLKGNCNDWFLFIFYIYEVVFREQNKLYAVMGGLNLPDGWNQGNHAYCLWRHNNGKFYVVESAVGRNSPWNRYVSNAIDAFGSIDYTHNFKYGRIVYMSNAKESYYQVVLK